MQHLGKTSARIEAIYLAYSALWHGRCDAVVANRMASLETEMTGLHPATLRDAQMQAAVALGATGSLHASRVLAPPVADAA